jgi:hypothetical protein
MVYIEYFSLCNYFGRVFRIRKKLDDIVSMVIILGLGKDAVATYI